jgi:hypothetical protein
MELEMIQSGGGEREKLVSPTFATLLLIVVMAVACIGVFGFVNLVLGSIFHGAASSTAATIVTLTTNSTSTSDASGTISTALTRITTVTTPTGAA